MSATRAEAPAEGERATSTRERILDIALDLFVDQGYDKTSLRQIADQLGFTKAAIYYHFASKQEILLALHMRLHALGREILGEVGEASATPSGWAALLDRSIDTMLANRKLFLVHERNRAAFEEMEHEHDDHEDLEELLRDMATNPAVPLELRLRMSCALGAVVTAMLLTSGPLESNPTDEVADALRRVVRDILQISQPR